MSFAHVQSCQIYYHTEGRGEPVLFLHGVPDSADIWLDTIAKLKSNFLCIAPDLPGFGRTRSPLRFDYGLHNLASFIDQFLKSLELTSVHLVIHDVGGIAGLAWASAHPDKVRSLTIMDTVFFPDYQWHRLAHTWRKPIVGDLAMHLMSFPLFAKALRKESQHFSDTELQKAFGYLSFGNRRKILRCYRSLDPSAFEAWQTPLQGLTQAVPTQVIWGANDGYLPASLANRFGATTINILEGCGHWPMKDQLETTHQLIEQWLTLHALSRTAATEAVNQ